MCQKVFLRADQLDQIISGDSTTKIARSTSGILSTARPRVGHAPVPNIQSSPSTCQSSNGYLTHIFPFLTGYSALCHRSARVICFLLNFFFLQKTRKKMMLKAAPAFALLNPPPRGENLGLLFSSFPSQSSQAGSVAKNGNGLVVYASRKESSNQALTGLIFEPFEEVKKELMLVPSAPQASLCRHKFVDHCEAAINEQINVEYNVSYVYHAMYAYFDRDNVALNGLAKFFKESSEEERNHAEKLMEYQNKRGGRVKLEPLDRPHTEFDHPEKGDALYAMEMALCFEKLTNDKLLKLHAVATENNDPQLAEFVESEYLAEQVDAIKKISEYVAQLRRVGKGHGVWHFDQMLLHEHDEATA